MGCPAVVGLVEMPDLHATIPQLLGLDHAELTCRFGARDIRLTDVSGRILDKIMILTLNHTSHVQGERDIMVMNFTTRDTGSFTGSQRLDGGKGVFAERSDFAGTFSNFSPKNNPSA